MLAILLLFCRIFPRSRWTVVRKDVERLKDSTIPSFIKLCARFPSFIVDVNKNDRIWTCKNGSQIRFIGESIDTDPELQRFHGFETNGFVLDDGDELQERTFVKCVERAGTWIVPDGQQPPPYVFVTFNPSPGWVKRRFYLPWRDQTMTPPYAFIPTTAADNPYLSDEQREAWKEMPIAEYQRFVMGDWDSLTGAYYDALTTDVLIDRSALPDRLPAHWRYWASFDWGYRHWSVMCAWATDPDGMDYLLDAIWLRKMQDDELAKAFLSELPLPCLKLVYAGHDCWAKPIARAGSGESTADVFAKAGIFLVRADIDPVNGGRAVNRQLAQKAVKIVRTPGTLRLYDQLGEMLPDPDDVRKPLKVDADEHGQGGDDGADSFRYGVATRIRAAILPKSQPEQQDRTMGYDYDKQEPRKRPTADEAFAAMIQPKPLTPIAGRHRVPRR